jgi:hypothetical protein
MAADPEIAPGSAAPGQASRILRLMDGSGSTPSVMAFVP